MAELARVVKTDLDISSEAEVLSYTYSGTTTKEVIARIDLGDSIRPIAGGGNYRGRFYINSILVSPDTLIDVAAGITRTILISRQVAIDPGDDISVKVLGLVADTQVNTVTSLRDATPVTITDVIGTGDVLVNHNYGGADALSYWTSGNVGIDNAIIRIYLTSNYVAGNVGGAYIIASTKTDVNGHWINDIMLDSGNAYTIIAYKQGEFGPDRKDITT